MKFCCMTVPGPPNLSKVESAICEKSVSVVLLKEPVCSDFSLKFGVEEN